MEKYSCDWKPTRLQNMRDVASGIAENRRQYDDVCAVLLFGSVATGDIHPESDLDLVVIKSQDKPLIKREQTSINGVEVDQWEHSNFYYERLFEQDWNPDEMFLYSLFLNILQNSEILYDRSSKFSEYKERALEWEWSKECKIFIQDKYNHAIQGLRNLDLTRFETLIYLKKVVLLETCKMLLDLGKPVSNRNKDLYQRHLELSSSDKFEHIFGAPRSVELDDLVKKGMDFFHSEIKNREPFTELIDARKHFSNCEHFLSSISLQNGVYYVGRYGLANRDVKLEKEGFLNPESEVELIRKSREAWREFFVFYEKVHSVEVFRVEDLDVLLQ